MRIGISLPNQVRDVDASAIPRWASSAEEAGFATLATTGRHAYPGVVDTVALAAAAGATTSIALLSGVTLAPTWPASLLAKQIAGIDGVSGGRMTLGIGIGHREDEFTVLGQGLRDRGPRLDSDLETYRRVWGGEPVGGGPHGAVPSGTRQVPMVFGGSSAATFRRMVRWGEGYVTAAQTRSMTLPGLDRARRAWAEAGRAGSPRLIAMQYFVLHDVELARANLDHFYGDPTPREIADAVGLDTNADAIRRTVADYARAGVDDLVFVPATDDLDEVTRLAGVVDPWRAPFG